MNFGEKFDFQRVKKGLNKKQLSEELKLSTETVGKYVKKENVEGIDAIILKRISDFFEVPVDYFTCDDEPNFIEIFKNELQYATLSKDIDLVKLFSEIKYCIDNSKCFYKEKEVDTDKKKYITDSLSIGLKLLDYNS